MNKKRHGMSSTHFYGIWKAISGRCSSPNNGSYKNYGAKGITSAWAGDFIKFKEEMYDSYLSSVEDLGEGNTSIDRVDNSKGYSKENCPWATRKRQCRNKTNNRTISYGGRAMLFIEWVGH